MKLSDIGDKINAINSELENLLRDTVSICIILSNIDGEILNTVGDSSNIDSMNIAPLAAGSFATTKGIANILGEREFSLLFHQGVENNIFISNIESYAILIVIFDKNSILGVIKQKSQQYRKNLLDIFNSLNKKKGRKKAPEKKVIVPKKETEKKDDRSKDFDFDSLMIEDIDDLF